MRHGQLRPCANVTPPVREADDTRKHCVRDFDGHSDCGGLRFETDYVSVGKPSPGRVMWMDQQRASRLPLHEPMRVVHPGVVAAKLPSSDQQEVTVGLCLHVDEQPVARLVHEIRRCDVDLAVGGADRPYHPARFERPEIDAMRTLAELCEREAMRPEAQTGIQESLRVHCTQGSNRQPAQQPGCEHPRAQVGHNLPIVTLG